MNPKHYTEDLSFLCGFILPSCRNFAVFNFKGGEAK